MATVINNPSSDSSSGAGWGLAVIIGLIVILALLFGIPALSNLGGGGAPAVSVPESIDVNVGGGGAGQ